MGRDAVRVRAAQARRGASREEEIIAALPRRASRDFKLPKKVVFGPLPTTATGKIQKFVLRERAKTL